MRLAIIPARGGSKRIPKKNIKEFFGRPIIGYSIEAAKSSGLFDQIVVSTDCEEIANISRHFGANVPFTRPNALADDYTSTASVIAHAIDWMTKNRWDVEALCCIYPTAPLMLASDIVTGYNIFKSNKWDFVFSAMEIANPQRAFSLNDDCGVKMFFPKSFSKRSQELTAAYCDAGQFYWGKSQAWLESRRMYSSKSTIVLIPANRVTDIDTVQDWQKAEKLFAEHERRK